MNLDALLVHRPPFRFVDTLVHVSSDAGVFALSLSPSDARLHEGKLAPLFLVEALAQSTAAFFGVRSASQPESGLLIELADVELLGAAQAGEEVTLTVQQERQLGPVARFWGVARRAASQDVLAQARITVARQAL